MGLGERCVRFAWTTLEQVDPQGTLTNSVIKVVLTGGAYLPWRTREEHMKSPHSATVGIANSDIVVAELNPPSKEAVNGN